MDLFDQFEAMVFTIEGHPGVSISINEVENGLDLTINVIETGYYTAAIDALYFDTRAEFPLQVQVNSADNGFSHAYVGDGWVRDMGRGLHIVSNTKSPGYDVGVAFSSSKGPKANDNTAHTIHLSSDVEAMTLDDLIGMRFGVKLSPQGHEPGVPGRESAIFGIAPEFSAEIAGADYSGSGPYLEASDVQGFSLVGTDFSYTSAMWML